VPIGNITLDDLGGESSQSLISYSTFAISGADDFTDGDTTVEEVFNIVVKTTREVTPTCEFFCRLVAFVGCVDPSLVKLELPGRLGTCESVHLPGDVLTTPSSEALEVMGGLCVRLSGFRRIVQAPSSSSTQFSSSETPFVHSMLHPSRILTTIIFRRIPSHRSQTRKRSRTCSEKMRF
jgi:hypothetical protein